MEPPPLTLLVVGCVAQQHSLSLTNCLAFQIPCVSAFRLDWQVCAIVVHVPKWATFFCIIHLKKGIGNWNKIFFFFSPTDLSACAKTVGNKKKKNKTRLRDSKFDRIPFKPSAAPTLPTAKGVHGCFFFTPKKRKKQQEHFWILCLCLSRASTAAPSYIACVCVCVCLLFLHLEIFLFCLILHASDVCKYLKFLSIFFPLLHSSSPDITFLLNRLLIH